MKAYVTILDGDLDLLPYFVRYYSRLGAEVFPVLVYDKPERFKLVHHAACDVIQAAGKRYVDIGRKDEETFNARSRDEYIREVHDNGGWAFFADLDEFCKMTAEQVQRIVRKDKVPYVEGKWVDRISKTGELLAIDPRKSLESQFPMKTKTPMSKLLGMGGPVYVLSSKAPRIHHPCTCEWGKLRRDKSIVVWVHHFKWQGNARTRLVRRMQRIRAVGKNGSRWAQRVRRTLKHLRTHDGIDRRLLIKAGDILNI